MSYSLAFSQAVAIVIFVAIKVENGIYDFVPTKEIAHSLNLPRPSAVKILQSLGRAGLIESREGARGGVRLGQPAGSITLLDIFQAIEQDRPLFRVDLKFRMTGEGVTKVQQQIYGVFQQAESAMKEELGKVRISDLYS